MSGILGASEPGETLAMLRNEDAAAGFVKAFDRLIERHGARSQGWDLSTPTWGEQPEAPLSLVRAQLTSEAVSPREMRNRSAARQRAATEQALTALPNDKHGEFTSIVAELAEYVGVDPAAQRSGAGRALIADMCVRLDAAAEPCTTDTSNEANIAYYERRGFRLLHHGQVPLGGPEFWTFRRDPVS